MSDEETTPLAKVLDLTTRMLQDIRGDLSQLNDKIGSVQKDVAKLQVDLHKLQVDVQKVQGDVEKVQGDVQKLQGDVHDLRGDVATMQVDLAAHQQQSRAFGDVLTYAVSGVRSDLLQVNERLQRLEVWSGTVDRRLDRLEARPSSS